MESKSIVTSYNKSHKNNAFQLPKISRTVLMQSESTLFDINRYQWLAEDRDYSQLSLKQVEQEYRLLRKQLLAVNDTAARSIEMFKSQNLGKKKRNVSSDYHSEVMSQQIENNRAILARLREELERLQIRQKQLEMNGKQTVEEMTQEVRENIDRVKQEIKQINTKKREINNSWQKQSKIQEQIKRLQVEKQIIERKRHKLEIKSVEVRQNNQKLVKQLSLLKEESEVADQIIEQELEIEKEKIQQSQMERIHRYKKHQFEALSKNIQSIQTSKSLKYHGVLKKIEEISNKSHRDQQQINEIEQRILIAKKNIAQLQEKLIQVKQNQKQHEKYMQILEQDTKMKLTDGKTQTQRDGSKIGRSSIYQKEKTDGFMNKLNADKKEKVKNGRVLRISSNKNKTIEVTLQKTENKQKQIQKESKQIRTHENDKLTGKNESTEPATNKIELESKEIATHNEEAKAEEQKIKLPAYQKLKTWNEQTQIDQLQVNRSSKKKIFNRILVDLNQTQNKPTKTINQINSNTKRKQTENNQIQQQFVFEQQIIND